jgi:hypothetical protein
VAVNSQGPCRPKSSHHRGYPSSVFSLTLEIQDEADKPDGKGIRTILNEALESYGGPFLVSSSYSGTPPTVLCLLLDSHWSLSFQFTADFRRDLIASKNFETVKSKLNVGVFISRTLWSWPSCLEEVISSVRSGKNEFLPLVSKRHSNSAIFTWSRSTRFDIFWKSI